MSLPSLVAAIDELGVGHFRGEVFRHVAAGREARSGRGARIFGGRWNPPDSFAVVYCGLDVQTVVDEFHRLARRQGVAAQGFLPRELYRLRVDLLAVLDLRGDEARRTIGLGDRELRSDDLSACQAIGVAAHSISVEAILAPSAANGGTALAVFLDALRPDSTFEVTGLEAVWEEPPEGRPRAPR
ncbi:MAG: RES family NAD+ phosphorylase [Gaiellaceae bacterium MAG52_C11]|nr:RES family NAD+ phosphorylase [Candidatus Gaiellasilicea maunaloa]